MQEKTNDLNGFDGRSLASEVHANSARSSFVQYTQMLTEAIEHDNGD